MIKGRRQDRALVLWWNRGIRFFSRPQPTTTDPYRTPGTKQIFETDSKKPLIGSLSHVVEHPYYKGWQDLEHVFFLVHPFAVKVINLF